MSLCSRASWSCVCVVLAASCLSGCKSAEPVPLTISVSPSNVQVEPGASFQFTAAGTGVAGGVSWLVESQPGGSPSVGTISGTGLYTAPPVSRAPVTVTCRSVADPNASARATVTFPAIAVTVSPPEASVALGGSQQFTARVTGAVDQTVTWQGADANGLFTAPTWADPGTTWTVTATSRATGATGSATVHLALPGPVLTSVTSPASVGQTVEILGSGFRSEASFDLERMGTVVYFPSGAGSPIPVAATWVSDTRVTAAVPQGAVSGPLWVIVRTHLAESPPSNEIPFQRLPNLRIRADRRVIAAGESVPLRVAWLGGPGALPLTASADVGRVQDGVYVAPDAVSPETYAHVTTCIEGTGVCDETVIGVQPFAVGPVPRLVQRGAALQLTATVAGSPVNAAWSRLSGGGTVSGTGLYTSSTALEDAGVAWLQASWNGVFADLQVGVRGAVPGLLNGLAELTDHRLSFGGTFTSALSVAGSRLHVVTRDPYLRGYGPGQYLWLDVFDLADPVRPAWVGAVESATGPDWLFTAHGRLYAYSSADPTAGQDSTLAVYDVTGALPVLVDRRQAPRELNVAHAFDGERAYFFEETAPRSTTVRIRIYATGGVDPWTLEETKILALPTGAESFGSATATADRAYVSYFTNDGKSHVAAYDLRATPPAFLSSTDVFAPRLGIAGSLLVAGGNTTSVLDRRGDSLAVVATFPAPGTVLDASASRALLKLGQRGLAVMEISDPSGPRLSTTLFDSVLVNDARLAGDLVVASEGSGGVTVSDVSVPGGLPLVGVLPAPWTYPYPPDTFSDLVVGGSYLHVTGSTWPYGGWVGSYDLTTSPPTLVSHDEFTAEGIALAVTDAFLVVGTSSDLQFRDRSSPGHPVPSSSLPVPARFLATDGRLVLASSSGTELVVIDSGAAPGPAEVARLDMGGDPFTIRRLAAGVFAVAVASEDRTDGWVTVVDVSTPGTPRIRSTTQLGVPAWGLDVSGATLFVATPAGLAVIGVASFDAPSLLSRVPLPGIYPYGESYDPAMAVSVNVHAGIAYVGTMYANGTVHGFDVRDPLWPRLVSLNAFADVIGDMVNVLAFHERWGFVGAQIVDTTQPRNVVLYGGAPPALQR